MNQHASTKTAVRDNYTSVALAEKGNKASACCGTDCCAPEGTSVMAEDYAGLGGYVPEADLGLGCGLPTAFAGIRPGDVVVDLGSGAGNDAFIAGSETGQEGKVIGIDFTPAMIERARRNAEVRGLSNVEFIEGDIEAIPLPDETADVIVSNCVLNLVPDKGAVFTEIHRVLKEGGHFSISDIVLDGTLPPALLRAAEMYAGCVSGAVQKRDYLQLIQNAGFINIRLQKEKEIHLPDGLLSTYLDSQELAAFRSGGTAVLSLTIYAEKGPTAPSESK